MKRLVKTVKISVAWGYVLMALHLGFHLHPLLRLKNGAIYGIIRYRYIGSCEGGQYEENDIWNSMDFVWV